jgi:hypothetical protein
VAVGVGAARRLPEARAAPDGKEDREGHHVERSLHGEKLTQGQGDDKLDARGVWASGTGGVVTTGEARQRDPGTAGENGALLVRQAPGSLDLGCQL